MILPRGRFRDDHDDFEVALRERLQSQWESRRRLAGCSAWRPITTSTSSPETVITYRKLLQSFIRSIEATGEQPVLGSVTKVAIDRWVSQQRFRHLAPEGIASRLAAVKVFTRKYLWLKLEVTTVDLLATEKRLAVEPEVNER